MLGALMLLLCGCGRGSAETIPAEEPKIITQPEEPSEETEQGESEEQKGEQKESGLGDHNTEEVSEPESEPPAEEETETLTPEPETEPAEPIDLIPVECADPKEIVMDFAGDVNFMDGCANMNYMAAQPGGITDCFSENLVEEMRSADIFMLNNEFAFSRRGEPLPGKSYTFRSDPDNAALLFDLGADIVGLANNHIYDYGEEALLDTLDTLDSAGMPHVGAGRDLADAGRPVYFLANGKTIAYTAATQIERSTNYTRAATEDSPGVLKTLDPTEYCRVLREAKKHADFVVAFVHWGTEGSSFFEGDQVALAEAFADAGADVIIGGHTHCLQGIAYVSDVPVIYSIGNFWFSSTPTDGVRPRDLGMAQVRLQEDGTVIFRFLPCRQENHRTTLYSEGAERERILAMEEGLSQGITIDPDGVVHR